MDFVEEYHPHRHKISKVMAMAYILFDERIHNKLASEGKGNISELSREQRDAISVIKEFNDSPLARSIPRFRVNRQGHWLCELLHYCFICVALFSAARKVELLTMNKGSYEKNKKTGISTVSGHTTKGNNGKKQFTIWNTAPISNLALELAFDATSSTRCYFKKLIDLSFKNGLLSLDEYNQRSDSLNSAFIKTSVPSDPRDILTIKSFFMSVGSLKRKNLNFSATETDVDEFDVLNPERKGTLIIDGDLPKLSSHDIRRSFVVFMVKNKLGDILTVKYQLKHRNINMSNWYNNYCELARSKKLLMDEQLKSEYDDALEQSIVDALDDIYNVSENLSGGEGERIAENKKEKLRHGELVYMTRRELDALVKSGDKAIVLLPTGAYCTNRNCERLCSLIDIVEAPCEHQVITDRAARKLAKEREMLIISFRAMNDMEDYANVLILDARRKKYKVLSLL
ncbi:hypothetical protein [Vibrio parahaemolyticus]|uniref:hypothetical protein n=1 Tax=Vibrio parahaemolyticus TaxID=670 RepID=UPI003133B896